VRLGLEMTPLLERFDAITFVPSVRVIDYSLSSKHKRSAGAVAIQDPNDTLEYAALEVDLLALRINNTLSLAGGRATRDAVLKSAADAGVIHFACHAAFDGGHPLESGLLLAGGRLSLADVYAHGEMTPGSLIVLAACESGLTGLDQPDELIGFPAAFLHAGASIIISTLWPVDDRATALLIDRFYEEYSRGASSSKALSVAQIWLRNVSAGEVLSRARSWLELGQALSIRRGSESVMTALALFNFVDRPFAHPRYWAGFICTGADAASWET
jgi:CHAT domain-containing protein